MDDIKLYAENELDIDSLIYLPRTYSKDTGMSFGLEKRGPVVSKKGKVIKTEGVELPEVNNADVQDSFNTLESHKQMATMMRRQGSWPQPHTYTN